MPRDELLARVDRSEGGQGEEGCGGETYARAGRCLGLPKPALGGGGFWGGPSQVPQGCVGSRGVRGWQISLLRRPVRHDTALKDILETKDGVKPVLKHFLLFDLFFFPFTSRSCSRPCR